MSIITISHAPFGGGRAVAERVASILDYRCVSREVLVEAGRRYGIAEAKLFEALEKEPKNWWSRWLGNPRAYRVALQATLCEFAQAGNLVYHGRAGEEFFPGIDHVLKILLVAPMEHRVRQVLAHADVCDEAAQQHLARLDKIRARRMQELYHADWRDPRRYDLTLSLAETSPDETARTIAAVAQGRNFQPTPESDQALRDLTIAAVAEATLRTSAATRNLDLEIEVGNGEVRVSGVLPAAGLEKAVAGIIEKIPGVTKVTTSFAVAASAFMYHHPA